MLQDYWAEGSMFIVRFEFNVLVPKEGFEPTHPFGYYVLNVARLPFRHFGKVPFKRLHHSTLMVGDRGLEPLTSCV